MGTGLKAAAVTKFGGGVGYYLGNLRPKGALIATTHGKAMGPVAVLKYYQSVGSMITQAGKRDAAQMGILDVDHPDIKEFIHVKDKDPQGLSTFNISVAATDRFMDGATAGQGGVDSDLLWEIAESAWWTGDPGLYFFDAAERGNPTPWLGQLLSTNPCGEVPLLNNEPCNLGSINLAKFLDMGTRSIDWGTLGDTVRLATRYLDDIVSLNVLPVDVITEANLRTRKIGLGVCGWADMLALLGIDYDSQEAINLGDRLMNFINKEAKLESFRLAEERGVAPAFEGRDIMLRNATRTCIAPTGTIAILMGASSGIEPHFALEWTRQLGNGDILNEYVPVLDQLEEGFIPKVSHEIGWKWHVRHQAAFQKHTDLAVSKTVNLPNDATVEDIYNAYVMAWQLGAKGVTVFRDGCRDEQVLRTSAPTAEIERCEACNGEVKYEEGCVSCAANCGWSACSV